MKKYIFTLFSAAALIFASCDDVLERPQLNNPQDDNYWRNETDLRLFGNGFYTNYFVGYNRAGERHMPLYAVTTSLMMLLTPASRVHLKIPSPPAVAAVKKK